MSNGTETNRRGPLADFLIRLVKEKPLGTVGALIVLLLFLTGILAPVLAPYGMNEINLENILEGPSGQYLLGTSLARPILESMSDDAFRNWAGRIIMCIAGVYLARGGYMLIA